jgi:Cof subfamily protein (haloacid dehalogenase superfamily)
MTGSLSDYLVVSDMDNTLLTAQGGIPQVNRDVIRLFSARGGRFTVGTGRPVESVRAALNGLALSCPAICCGGSVIYDFSREKCLERHALDRARTMEILRDVLTHFPQVGIEVQIRNGDLRIVRANACTQAHLRDEKLGCVLQQADDIPEPWVKAVFAGPASLIDRIEWYVSGKQYGSEVYLVRTTPVFYEIMPAGVSKASGLQALCSLCDIPIEKTIVIGDYYNDLAVMKAAGHSVAVAGAPSKVRLAADYVTVTGCAEGAVAEFLYRLMRRYEA